MSAAGTVGVVLTVMDAVKLGMSLWALWGKSQGMTEEELVVAHNEALAEFRKSDPAGLIKLLEEKMK